nr:cyclic GMP-AMP synthase isoform X3 [Hydra vulgaris]
MEDLKGCEKNDPEALTNEQQKKLDSFKIKTRISNENYLRSHPEIDCLLTNFISEICKQKPNNVREYAAGSSFEKLNICGENIIEFDIMLVVDRDKLLELENEVSGGYVKIKCANSMLDYPRDNEGCINAKAYREYFYGIVQKWVNIMKHPKTIKLIYHGVATQINVYTVKEILWYQVDLVPCFKLYERKCCINFCPKPLYFVPKPVEGKPYNWRLSHSLKEVRAANKLHSQAKKSVRVVKAIFKFRSNGLFKDKFTSFHIKTAAFHLVDTGWPDKRNMGHNIYTFLVFIKKCLQNRELIHRFDPTINLLADYNTNLCLQMVRAIDLWLMSMNNFLSRLL